MGFVQILRAFPSPPEGFPRTLRIHLPDAYFAEPERRFGVLYMHDGQNLYDHPETACVPSWGVDSTLEGLARGGELEPWIVVGVDHGVGRFEEYSPWPEPREGVKGRAPLYAAFLVDHLKPFVDQSFRTRPEREMTAVAGSSLGGLVTLFLALTRAEVFGRVGAFSPSTMWCDRGLFRHWREKVRPRIKMYLDAGATEAFDARGTRFDYGTAVREFGEHLRGLGYGDEELRTVLEPGGQHGEADWRRRFPDAMRWLLR